MDLLNKYYVHTIAPFNGDHIIHREDCCQLPLLEHCMHLGEFAHCEPAVDIAKKTYKLVSAVKIVLLLVLIIPFLINNTERPQKKYDSFLICPTTVTPSNQHETIYYAELSNCLYQFMLCVYDLIKKNLAQTPCVLKLKVLSSIVDKSTFIYLVRTPFLNVAIV